MSIRTCRPLRYDPGKPSDIWRPVPISSRARNLRSPYGRRWFANSDYERQWGRARRAMVEWWYGKGLALHVTAPKEGSRAPADSRRFRQNSQAFLQSELDRLQSTFFGGVALPMLDTDVGGPGSLGLFLGAGARLDETTVWYEPCIHEPESHPPLHFDRDNEWSRLHLAVIDAGLAAEHGRFLVPMPDLIENLDTLAQLRGTERVLIDMVERPDWVKERLRQINQAYFASFSAFHSRIKDSSGGNAFFAFQLWGPGKTAKVQCDLSCAISPAMFNEFVVPPLREQCEWLDYAMYHLDGTQALKHVDTLLAIPEIRAIEWTPQAGLPRGGSPEWYPLYRKIKETGKSVQAVEVAQEEVEPLIAAVGREGLFIITQTETEKAARNLLDRMGWPSE